MRIKLYTLALLAFMSLDGFAQSGSNVKGQVVDKWGRPIYGALVSISDSPLVSVATDKTGHFEIAAANDDKLHIVAPNVSVKNIKAGELNKNNKVVMDMSSQKVNYGFGLEQTLSESTGAVSVATSEEINTRSSKTIGNSLYGNALGLTTMQKSGAAWDQMPSMYIRGLQTLNGNNGILVVVDGLERDNAYNVLNYITPEEVESVTILRDAAAIALYGYKGANGVLNIVTKRGKFKSREISFSYDHAFNTQIRRPDLADSYTYGSAINEALSNDGMAARYSSQELDAFKSGKYPSYYPNVNWWDETLRDVSATDIATLSFRGGGMKLRYFTMLNLQNDRGFMANANQNEGYSTQEKYSKLNFRTNLDIELAPKTKMQANIMGVLNEYSRPGLGSDNLMSKLYTLPSAAFPIKTADGLWGGNATWDGYYNPVALTQGRAYSKAHTRGLYADMAIKQDLSSLTEGLGFSIRVGYDNIASYWEDHTKNYKYGSQSVTAWKDGAPSDFSSFTGGANSEMSGSSKLDWQYRSFNFNSTFDYKRSFGDHDLYTALIYSYKYDNRNGINTTFYHQNLAWYTHYGYKGRYYADLSLVNSASNVLEKGKKWHLSPTVGLAWVASNEDFMKDLSWVNFFKLRASAGIINTDYIPVNGYWQSTYEGNGGGYPIKDNFGNDGSWQEGRLPSVNGTVEKAYKYNLGIDAQLVRNLSVTADVYYQRRKDIWVSTSGHNSSVLGASSSYENAGIVDSWGTELGADWNQKINDFQFNVGGKFTLAKNKIVEQYETPQAYDYLKSTGRPVGQIFGLQAVGFFSDEADIKNSPVQQFGSVKPGDIKYKDQNGDKIIDENDYIAMGYNSTVPEVYYSFNLGFEWKGLGLSADFQGVSNYTGYLSAAALYRPLVDNVSISNYYYENRWTPENPNAKFPRLTTETVANNQETSSLWLINRSFLKLRNCEVYYKLPSSLLNNIHVSNAKVYVRGVDLLCFDGIKQCDPEAMNASYPLTRSINLGLSVGF